MCKFCEGGKERQQFSSATGGKKLWVSSVLCEHGGFTLVGDKGGNDLLWVPAARSGGSLFQGRDTALVSVVRLRTGDVAAGQFSHQKEAWISFQLPKSHPCTAANPHFHYWAALEKGTALWTQKSSTVTAMTPSKNYKDWHNLTKCECEFLLVKDQVRF